MSEHATKHHPIAAFIVLIVIGALCAWGFGLMNSGTILTGAGAAALMVLFGGFVILALGPGDDA